mmetsp:Transcript_19081/g.55367  ORF Transcript_19081/g.55367 Transcript_19081/m.55367 type:complete len:222 (-) Transcript_19081:436-1101(-)
MGRWLLTLACQCVSGKEQTCTAKSSQAKVGKPPSLVLGIWRWRSHHLTQRNVKVTNGATTGGGAAGRGAAPTRWNQRTWSTGRVWSTETSTAMLCPAGPHKTRKIGTLASSMSSIEKFVECSEYWLMSSCKALCTRRRTSTGNPTTSNGSRRVKQTTSTSLPGVSTRRAALPTNTRRPKLRSNARRQASSTVATKPCCVSRNCCMCRSIADNISISKASPE